MPTPFNLPDSIAPVLIQLLKGVLYQDRQPQLWQDLLSLQAPIRDYLAVIGLRVFIDETEGYAFVRQAQAADEEDEGSALPRLVPRRQLSYPVSLLCVLLRKKLIELDASGGETRLILSREQIIDMVRVFLPQQANEAKWVEQIDSHINRVIDYGFLRRLKGDEQRYEVGRIIKALVDADWLGDIDHKLKEYQTYADTAD